MLDTLTERPAVSPRPQSKAAHVPPAAQWLVLAYLAADNDELRGASRQGTR